MLFLSRSEELEEQNSRHDIKKEVCGCIKNLSAIKDSLCVCVCVQRSGFLYFDFVYQCHVSLFPMSEPPRDACGGAHQRAAEGQMAEVWCCHLLHQRGFLPHHHDHLHPGGLLPSDTGKGGWEAAESADVVGFFLQHGDFARELINDSWCEAFKRAPCSWTFRTLINISLWRLFAH